jgi:hypothetical protein
MSVLPPVELLEYVAETLGDLREEAVFLGGAVLGLLVTDEGAPPPRFTKDVDVAVQVGGSFLDAYELDRRLLALGFSNDMQGPVCRYLHGPAIVDVIPVHTGAVGAVNAWYPHALETAMPHTLSSGRVINLITPACFLGTKFFAFRAADREHHDDVFLSRDFNDIVQVIDGRSSIVVEVRTAPEHLRGYLREHIQTVLRENYIQDAVADLVEPGREALVFERLHACLA